ncbi:MAG: putative solute:sodium symporter small subunit [Gammaproteobacteria bacterium]|jgi:putative solute:sodium symporter small subunit
MNNNEQTQGNNDRIDSPSDAINTNAYWHANLKIIASLLAVWFVASFGCGILFVEQLNEFTLYGFKFGFWWAQQGSIYVFVILIFVYVALMQSLDRRFGVSDDDNGHT